MLIDHYSVFLDTQNQTSIVIFVFYLQHFQHPNYIGWNYHNMSSPSTKLGPGDTHPTAPLETVFTCKQCGASFRYKSNLTKHERKHSGIFQYYCPYCQKGESATANLKNHLKKYHTGVETFRCIHCGLDLSSVHGLKQHLEECTCKKGEAGEGGEGATTNG